MQLPLQPSDSASHPHFQLDLCSIGRTGTMIKGTIKGRTKGTIKGTIKGRRTGRRIRRRTAMREQEHR